MNSLRIGVIGIPSTARAPGWHEGCVCHDFEELRRCFMRAAPSAVLIAGCEGCQTRGRHVRPPACGDGDAAAISSSTLPEFAGTIRSSPPLSSVRRRRDGRVHSIRTGRKSRRRASISSIYPSQVGAWTGSRDTLEQVYLDALHLD